MNKQEHSAFSGAGAMGVAVPSPPSLALVIGIYRDEPAKCWHAMVNGIPSPVATASTISAVLHQLAYAIEKLAVTYGRPDWLDWHETTLPVLSRGEYW